MKSNKIKKPNSYVGIYTTNINQNISYVAIDVHGTVNGITDILVHNEWLSIDSEIKAGTEIGYSTEPILEEQVVVDLDRKNITPINSSRNVYYKPIQEGKIADIFISDNTPEFHISRKGGGELIVDWGDNSELEIISPNQEFIFHSFDISEDSSIRRIRIYKKSNDEMSVYVKTPSIYQVFLYHEVDIYEYEDNSPLSDLSFFQMMRGLKRLKINNVSTNSLESISSIETLRDIEVKSKFISQESMDRFFIGIIENYGERLPAKINVSVKPNGDFREPQKIEHEDGTKETVFKNGMEAVWQLVNDPEWNSEFYKWQIIIDGTDFSQASSEEKQ